MEGGRERKIKRKKEEGEIDIYREKEGGKEKE